MFIDGRATAPWVNGISPAMFDIRRATDACLRRRSIAALLVFDNWPGSIALLIAGLATSFLLFGFWWPYWRIFDMDVWMVYEAWLSNDGLPQEWFDHPGYLTILLLGDWFWLLHQVGLMDAYSLSAVSTTPDASAWTAAVRAGRVYSLLLASTFVVGFALLLRRLIKDWRVAALGAFALAFSGGLLMEARVIRTELVASGFVTCAILILLVAARSPGTIWRPLLVGLAALLATLAMTNKVQVIFLIAAIPLIVMPFGEAPQDHGGFWRKSQAALPVAGMLVIGASLIALPAWSLVLSALSAAQAGTLPWRPLFGTFGIYQAMLAAYAVLAMLCYARLWQVSRLETVAGMAAVLAGVALGLTVLDVRFNLHNVLVVLNPLEQLRSWAAASDPSLMQSGQLLSGRFLWSLVEAVGAVVARRTFILQSSSRPTIFLEWLVIAMAIVAWRSGKRKLAVQTAILMLVVWGVDTLGVFRGLKLEYFILTDPLVVIAAAWLLANLVELQTHRWAYQVGAVLIIAHIVVGHSPPVKHSFLGGPPVYFCVEHFGYTKRIEHFAFCPVPSP